MSRIIIIGNAGAGKSTLAVKLSERLAIPVYHLDKLLWKEGWERTPEEEFELKHKELIMKNEWIIDGVAYKSTFDERFSRAQVIIFLDEPLVDCVEHAKQRIAEEKIRPNPYVNRNCSYDAPIEEHMKVMVVFHEEYRPWILEKLEHFKEKTIILREFDSYKEKDMDSLINSIKNTLEVLHNDD
ncbi:MAG: AAA family ATPase [Candidatus Heimdallarchaeota archaeon]|nr:AAA family ATPase [Candidatus Heimdallarchaeota archaeon]